MKLKKIAVLLLVVVLMGATLIGCASPSEEPVANGSDESWEPTQTPIFIAAAAAGSGYDTSARNFAKVLNDTGIVDKNIKIENISGGAGALGFTQFGQQYIGDPNTLISASAATITAAIGSNWEVSYEDFTPVARLITDYVVLVTSADNTEYNTVEDVIEKLQTDPGSIKIGGAAPPDADYIALMMLLQEIGVESSDISYAAYDGGGELIPAMMGGHIDVSLSTAGEWMSALDSGQIKSLVVFSPDRLEGALSDTPTLMENGYDVEFGSWRGVWGPKDMPEDAVKYWQNAFTEVAGTEEWAEVCEAMQWTPNLMTEGYEEWVADFYVEIKQTMQRSGIID